MFLHHLRQGGYPFRADDLTLEEWLALGDLESWREEERMKLRVAGLTGKV